MSDFELMLTADSRGLVSGDRALDKIGATAEKTERQVTKATGAMSKGLDQTGKSSIFASQQMRMTSMQLSQVAQQASATGNWIQAIAIQLPDLALGFGTFGILAGAAAGALLPLLANLVSTQDEADDLAKTIKTLQSATEAYEQAVANASLTGAELVSRFGEQAEQAQEVYEALRRIAELDYYRTLSAAQEGISSALSGLEESVGRVQVATTNFFPADAIVAAQQEIQYLNREFGLTLVQANSINNALQELSSASGPREAAEAAKEFSDALDQAASEGARITPEMRDVQKQALQAAVDASRFANLLGQANGEAGALAGTMGAVADEATRAANSIAAALNAQQTKAIVDQLGPLNTLNAFERTPFQDEMQLQNERAENTKSQFQLAAEKAARSSLGGGRRRGGGGGGGRSSVDKGLDDDHREATRLFEETRTAAEKYEKELDRINNLHDRGFIDADTYGRAIKQLGDDYKDTGEQAKFFEEINEDVKNGILDAIMEGKNLGDVFEGLAKKIARAALEAALFGSGPLAQGGGAKGGGFGGILGGIFGKLFSFDGGGYTGDGTRSGGIDGKGGYMALIHPQETIIDHTKGGGGSSAVQVGVVSRFDADGNFESKVESISSRTTASGIGQFNQQLDKDLPGRISNAMERNSI